MKKRNFQDLIQEYHKVLGPRHKYYGNVNSNPQNINYISNKKLGLANQQIQSLQAKLAKENQGTLGLQNKYQDIKKQYDTLQGEYNTLKNQPAGMSDQKFWEIYSLSALYPLYKAQKDRRSIHNDLLNGNPNVLNHFNKKQLELTNIDPHYGMSDLKYDYQPTYPLKPKDIHKLYYNDALKRIYYTNNGGYLDPREAKRYNLI